MEKAVGLVVIVFALYVFTNGSALLGWNLNLPTVQSAVSASRQDQNEQVVEMIVTASGYQPNTFEVVQGVPVKWIITSKDPNSCASSIVSAKLGVRTSLHPGENIIEFTPKEVGVIKFSCSMGMYIGSFNVVEKGNDTVQDTGNQGVALNNVPAQQPGNGVGCGSGCGGGKVKTANGTQAPSLLATEEGGVQILKTVYTNESDIIPNEFIVKKGKPVRLEIQVKEQGFGCMGSIYIPGLTENPQILNKRQTIEFTPEKSGNYPITCAMGVPRGSITVS